MKYIFTLFTLCFLGTLQAQDANFAWANVESEKSYFRLQMVDLDGTAKFSNVISVTGSCDNLITTYANPTRNVVIIKGLKGKAQIRLIDNLGK